MRATISNERRDHVEESKACLRYAAPRLPTDRFSYNSIEAKEPAFLQKLRGQYGTTSGRLERPAARPRKPKNGNADDDDEPVYVDEESNEVISKEEYQALVGSSATRKEGEASLDDQPTAGEDKARTEKEPTAAKQSNLTEVGGQRKRKQVKVVGEDQPEVEKTKPENEEAQPKPAAPRKPKKAKKIKLSFEEE